MVKNEKMTSLSHKSGKLRWQADSQDEFLKDPAFKVHPLIGNLRIRFHMDPLHILIPLLILMILTPFVFYFYYLSFLDQLKISLPLFTELNAALLNRIPPPAHAAEIIRISPKGGINNYQYGPDMIVSYKYSGMSESDVFDYYNNLLVNRSNWMVEGQTHSDAFFQNESACLALNINAGTYTLRLWQSLENQKFSPSIPPDWLLKFFDNGYGQGLTCR